ncbi:MAG: alpha/beta hydrolase [Acidobacteria bacterium]|nr:alpha/beta hydrolase [Acidobacteriota bacterium]
MKPKMIRLFVASAFAVALLPAPTSAQADTPSPLVAALDTDGDGTLASSELPAQARRVLLFALDADDDGVLSAEELDAIGRGGAGRGRKTRRGPDNWDFSEETANRVRIVRNLEYATGDAYAGGRGKLDLYIPAGDGPHPVIVFFHGGGLYNGDKHSLVDLGPRFASLGFLVAAPNYRLSPEYAYPAYIEDAAAAFRWVWDHIRDYGGDRDRIAVSGGSAGGHIAALLSVDERYLRAHDLDLGNIRASLPITGLMNAERAGRERHFLTWRADPELVREASPIRYVASGLPPMLITVADGDTENRRQQNVNMFEAMEAAGAEVEFEWLVDRTHNSIRPNMAKEGDATVELLLDFLRRHGMAP